MHALPLFLKFDSDIIHLHEHRLCYRYRKRATTAILSLEAEFLSWLTESEKPAIQRHFEEASDFPSCIGCVDGTTFKLMNAPSTDPECYFSRMLDYCIGAQLICDHRWRITFYQVQIACYRVCRIRTVCCVSYYVALF